MNVPIEIREAIAKGAVVSVSVSGGKDSQAMLTALRSIGWDNALEIVHADLGRADPSTSDRAPLTSSRTTFSAKR